MTAARRRRTAMDRRYGSRRWKATRLRILHRDLWACFVPGCPQSASVADHIIAVYPEMPNSLFFDEMNLRASCKPHNTARGVAARLERELAGRSETPPERQGFTEIRFAPRKVPQVY
jgi:5-methylcytosine-specific restriction endonuclease McrA